MTPLETRKAQLREYIEARKDIEEFINNVPTFSFGGGNSDRTIRKLPTKIIEIDTTRIAEQLLECIEALEFYSISIAYQAGGHAAGPNVEENYPILRDVGFLAMETLNKIAGEK